MIVSFEDTTKHKPDPEPLILAMHTAHAQPKEVVYVGDQEVDFLAAKAAGTKIIMVSKHPFDDADAWIKNFEELPQTISSIS